MTAALELTNVSVNYGNIQALEKCSLRLEPGTVTGLIGMNGSGKTTLFKTVMGAVRPSQGTVTIDGVPAGSVRQQGLIAYMPQNEDVDWNFPVSVADVVMMGRYGQLGFTRKPRKVDRHAVADALERVGLSDHAGRQIGKLSGGQRKRAFVARSIAQKASLLLLDEPFAGVDSRSAATIAALLRDLAREGATVLVSTHDLNGLAELADDAALLLRRVLFHGPVNQALEPRQLARAFGLDSHVETDGTRSAHDEVDQ